MIAGVSERFRRSAAGFFGGVSQRAESGAEMVGRIGCYRKSGRLLERVSMGGAEQ